MLLNSATSVMPVPVQFVRLNPEEILFHSFVVTEQLKQGMGYQSDVARQYRCHFTNQRLLLEPLTAEHPGLTRSQLAQLATPIETATVPCFAIAIEQIQQFKRVRSLGLASYGQIVLVGESDAMPVLLPQPADQPQASPCSSSFVALGNRLLNDRANPSKPMPMFKDNAAKVAQFHQILQASDTPILVDFLAPGCKPCEQFGPMVATAIQPFGDRLTLVQVNLEETPSIPMQYGVDCFPTLLLFKQGAIAERIVGVVPAAIITKVINRHFTAEGVSDVG